jgi:hypothetical protein
VEGVRFLALAGVSEELTWDLAVAWKPRGTRRAVMSFLQTVRSASPLPLA